MNEKGIVLRKIGDQMRLSIVRLDSLDESGPSFHVVATQDQHPLILLRKVLHRCKDLEGNRRDVGKL